MTTPAPTLAGAPTVEQIAAVPDHVERARLITTISRTYGTLPGPLATMRRAAITAALAEGWRAVKLAAEIGLSKSRISQLTRPTGPAADTTEGTTQ